MLPESVIDLLRSQHGVLADHQLVDRLDPPDRRRVFQHPELERLTARVRRHRVTPVTAVQAAMAAVLDHGRHAMLWGKSAAAHWGFGPFRITPVHVAVPRPHRSRPAGLGQRHVLGSIGEADRTTFDGIPISRPELTLLWIAGALTHRFGHERAAAKFEPILDDAWRRRLVDGCWLHALAERAGGRGRSGIVVLRQALEQRPPSYRPAGSRLEERFESILPERVRVDLARQVTVGVEPVVRTVDYRCRRWPLVAEINGEAFHSSIADRRADEQRYEFLLARGFSVVVWWEHDIWHDPGAVRHVMTRLVESPDRSPTLHRPTAGPWQ